MPFFHHRYEAPGELANHKAALNRYTKKYSLPPMQQTQQIPLHQSTTTPRVHEISARLNIGNVFQEGETSLPVMYLPEHHLSQLQKLRAQRPKDSSSPQSGRKRLHKEDKRVEADEKMEKRKRTEKNGSTGEDQPRTTDIVTQPTSIYSKKIRKASPKKIHKHTCFTSFKKLFRKSPKESPADKVREKVEKEVDSRTEMEAKMSPLFKPDTKTFENDPNLPLR